MNDWLIAYKTNPFHPVHQLQFKPKLIFSYNWIKLKRPEPVFNNFEFFWLIYCWYAEKVNIIIYKWFRKCLIGFDFCLIDWFNVFYFQLQRRHGLGRDSRHSDAIDELKNAFEIAERSSPGITNRSTDNSEIKDKREDSARSSLFICIHWALKQTKYLTDQYTLSRQGIALSASWNLRKLSDICRWYFQMKKENLAESSVLSLIYEITAMVFNVFYWYLMVC